MNDNMMKPVLPSAPSYGFGTAERVQADKQYIPNNMIMSSDKDGPTGHVEHGIGPVGLASPGPVYYPRSPRSTAQGSIGTSPRREPLKRGKVADPGQYSMRSSWKFDGVLSSWKFGTSTRDDHDKVFISAAHAKREPCFIDSPGPMCSYHKSSLGKQSDSRRVTAASFGVGSEDRYFFRPEKASWKTPGPGTYKVRSSQGRQVTSNKPSCPSAAFSRASKDALDGSHFLGSDSPGPALFGPTASVGKQVSSPRRSAPKFGFGTADRFS